MAGIRLYFTCFSTNYFNSEQRKHRMLGVRLKNQLKAEVLAQLTGKYTPIDPRKYPILIDFTFISAHKYDIDNYSTMAKYILDCIVSRNILQDDNPNVVNEIRIRVKAITNKSQEGCLIRFYKNPTPKTFGLDR